MKKTDSAQIAVVIPSYHVTHQILDVISSVPPDVCNIYVIDDACPDGSGRYVEDNCADPRVRVIYHEVNQGVGGAVMTGYSAAIYDGCDVIVKIDGDGQMDPRLIPVFIGPIIEGDVDYVKGNRFFDIDTVRSMPKIRLIGNAFLSFMTKLSSGYWNIFDPTNGYTAINAKVVRLLPFDKISRRYFFETDMLFRLNILRAVVMDVPMDAKYGDEVSNLKIKKVIGEFIVKHSINIFKRIFYNYYLRDLSLASIELVFGALLLLFGVGFGVQKWLSSMHAGIATPVGTIMVAVLPILLGMQFLLAFIGHDISSVPNSAIGPKIRKIMDGLKPRENILNKTGRQK